MNQNILTIFAIGQMNMHAEIVSDYEIMTIA